MKGFCVILFESVRLRLSDGSPHENNLATKITDISVKNWEKASFFFIFAYFITGYAGYK